MSHTLLRACAKVFYVVGLLVGVIFVGVVSLRQAQGIMMVFEIIRSCFGVAVDRDGIGQADLQGSTA